MIGDFSVLGEGAERANGGGGGVGGGRGIPPPTVGTFAKITVSKSHFRAFKNMFYVEKQNPKIYVLQHNVSG